MGHNKVNPLQSRLTLASQQCLHWSVPSRKAICPGIHSSVSVVSAVSARENLLFLASAPYHTNHSEKWPLLFVFFGLSKEQRKDMFPYSLYANPCHFTMFTAKPKRQKPAITGRFFSADGLIRVSSLPRKEDSTNSVFAFSVTVAIGCEDFR